MKKSSCVRSAVFAAVFFIMTILSAIPVSAQCTAEFIIPDGAVHTGEHFNVTVVFSADTEIGWVESNFVYDNSAAQFISGNGANGGGGILTLKEFASGETNELSVTLEFAALKESSTEMSVSNCAVFGQDSSMLGSPYAYGIITIAEGGGVSSSSQDEPESLPDDTSSAAESLPDSSSGSASTESLPPVATDENGNPTKGALKSLTVSQGKLVPEFSPDIYNYTVKVDNSVDYLEVEGVTAGITDYIWYEGSNYLQVGDNIRRITVTADTGAKRTYIITIQREAGPENEQANADTSLADESAAPPANESYTDSRDLHSRVIVESEEDPLDRYKKILMPALGIVMFVLILALVIVVTWLRKKADADKDTHRSANKKR